MPKKTLLLVYPCYLCKENEGPSYSKAAQIIMHVRNEHGYLLPSRRTGVKRPLHSKFAYSPDPAVDFDERQYACPSCWFHTDRMDNLSKHIDEEHDPPVCEPQPNASSYYSRRRGRPSSTSSFNQSTFVYAGTKYEKKAVNSIFKQIQDLTTGFKELLKLN